VERATSDRDQREYATPTQSKALRVAGLAAVVTLLLTLIGVLTAISLNPELATQVLSIGRGTEDSGDEQVALAEPDGTGQGSTSLGEAEQAERKRRDDETARNKKRAEEAARIALEEERKQKIADEERMKLKRQQKQEAERAAEQQALANNLKKQKTAYEAIANHEAITVDDLPVAGGIGGGPQKQAVICRLDPDNLLDLSFDLAVSIDPLSEGQPFEATVQPSAEQRLNWQISATPTRTIDKDSNAKPIPLATISVTDGQLVLKPARNEILGNQLFSHLRQSVLLVKARNPEQPDAAAGIVKAIQLVRPVAKGPFKVDLLSSSTKIDLSPPRGIFANTTAGKQEGFPRSAVVEYEIAYGFTLNGTQKEEVYSRKWTSAERMPFVPILQCPQSPNVQPNSPPSSPPSVGLQIAFGAGLSPLIISPEIQGLGKDAFDLHAIARTIRHSDDEFQKQLNILDRQLANKIRPFCGPVDGVNVSNLSTFIKQHERDLAEHLQAEACAAWIKDWQQILVQAAQVPRPAKNLQVPGRGLVDITPAEFERNIAPSRAEWQRVFVERIEDWAKDRAKRQQEQSTQIRKYFTPLRTPVQITVRTITTIAAKDETKYTVTLLKGDPDGESQSNSSGTPPASDLPQL
jgi:hypothetical protein